MSYLCASDCCVLSFAVVKGLYRCSVTFRLVVAYVCVCMDECKDELLHFHYSDSLFISIRKCLGFGGIH